MLHEICVAIIFSYYSKKNEKLWPPKISCETGNRLGIPVSLYKKPYIFPKLLNTTNRSKNALKVCLKRSFRDIILITTPLWAKYKHCRGTILGLRTKSWVLRYKKHIIRLQTNALTIHLGLKNLFFLHNASHNGEHRHSPRMMPVFIFDLVRRLYPWIVPVISP
jgi:hypothetical protein